MVIYRYLALRKQATIKLHDVLRIAWQKCKTDHLVEIAIVEFAIRADIYKMTAHDAFKRASVEGHRKLLVIPVKAPVPNQVLLEASYGRVGEGV